MLTHNEENKCKYTDKRLFNLTQWKCKICDRGFKRSSHLKRHMLIHTGDQPWKCNVCDKRFSQACNLKQHRVTLTM